MVELHARNMRAMLQISWGLYLQRQFHFTNDYKIMYYARQLKRNSGNPQWIYNVQLCRKPVFYVYYPVLLVPFNQLIEACVQNCGQRFHTEVGKYRFLNELIKLISSKVITFLITTLFVVEGAVSWDSFTMVNDLFIVRNFVLLVHVTRVSKVYFPYANVTGQIILF